MKLPLYTKNLLLADANSYFINITESTSDKDPALYMHISIIVMQFTLVFFIASFPFSKFPKPENGVIIPFHFLPVNRPTEKTQNFVF